MMDFTSSLYLGFTHPKNEIPIWHQLTDGKPAVLSESGIAKKVSYQIAHLQGLETGLVGPSTLHFFWDLFGLLEPEKYIVFSDVLLYPVGKTGIERAQGKGMQVIYFKHLSQHHLRRLMTQYCKGRRRPIVVTDGWCPRCGKPAPLPAYLQLIQVYRGLLVIDDTQSIGILGERNSNSKPYGIGGGGILKWWDIQGPNVLTISSLAKGFGVPIASLCGHPRWIKRFSEKSVTRTSNSPVSYAHLAAAQHALELNSAQGDHQRSSLCRNIQNFRRGVWSTVGDVGGGWFPVQTISCWTEEYAIRLYRELLQLGIRSVLVAPHGYCPIALMFIIRADHRGFEIKRLKQALLSMSKRFSFLTTGIARK